MNGPGRMLSCALTEDQVLDRSKTETRRLGWWVDKNGRRLVKVGDRLQLVRKAMGRKPGEPVVVLAVVEVTSVHREHLDQITQESVTAEGFPDWGPSEFIEFFCRSMKCEPGRLVTVIRWRYLNAEVGFHVDKWGRRHQADFGYLGTQEGSVQCLHHDCEVTINRPLLGAEKRALIRLTEEATRD